MVYFKSFVVLTGFFCFLETRMHSLFGLLYIMFVHSFRCTVRQLKDCIVFEGLQGELLMYN